jgi:signal transduction histidine kinase
VEILGDRQLLGSAVHNLLLNAFKFTARGGHVVLRTSATPERVLIEVQDQCGGIPDHVSSRLFKPFQQATSDGRGMGLGLVISRRAIEAIHGRLSLRNEPGTGCVFAIDLPRIVAVAV